MSAVPAEIAGIGSTLQKLRARPGFDPLKAALGPEEYFVFSRIDGQQSLREVLLTTGLPVDRAIAIVQRLRAIGALLVPGETGAPANNAVPQPIANTPASQTTRTVVPPMPSTPTGPRPLAPNARTGPVPVVTSSSAPNSSAVARPASSVQTSPMPVLPGQRRPASAEPAGEPGPSHDLSLTGMTPLEMSALREDVPIDDGTRRRILAMARLADGRDPWALLGVPAGSDARQLKRAYFRLSKDTHPDRYFGQPIGSFGARLPVVFEALSRAYARLTSPDRSAANRAGTPSRAEQPQTPQEYAGELFERACQLEVSGGHLDAMKLFAAAVRVDPQPRYLRRAASCALAAGQPKTAVEYAKKAHSLAPTDPSSARLLAAAFRAAGKLSDAEEVLVLAMALKSENDVLGAELRYDLAEVRRLLGPP